MNDDFLEVLVKAANQDNDFACTLTVWISGAIVSGTLVGVSVYIAGIADTLTSANVGEMGKTLATGFQDIENRRDVTDEPAAFHLRGARGFVSPDDAFPNDEGVWWRGRLESVDGWFLGTI